MYVLIHSANKLLDSRNTAHAFRTYEEAYAEMARRFNEVGSSDGYATMPPDELGVVRDEEGVFVGCLMERDAWVEDCKSHWTILETKEV